MQKLNILITTVGGLTSPDILKAYKNSDEFDIKIIGTDAFEFAVGRKFVNHFHVVINSAKDDLAFAKDIQKLVQKYHVDVVIPCGNEDNLALAKYKDLISCPVMVSEYEDLILAYDKGEVYKKIQKKMPKNSPKFHIVTTYEDFLKAVKDLGYPNDKVVIKPRFGRGGRGVYILSGDFNYKNVFTSKPVSEYPLEFFETILKKQNRFEELIVMEYLSEPFYSVYSLCKNGENLLSLNHTREWGNASQTFRGKVFYDEKLEKIASLVIDEFNLSYTNNMEFATSKDGEIVLFDLNPRIGASSGIDKDIGFNFPLEALKICMNDNIKIDKSKFLKPKRFIRYFDQVWIDD